MSLAIQTYVMLTNNTLAYTLTFCLVEHLDGLFHHFRPTFPLNR